MGPYLNHPEEDLWYGGLGVKQSAQRALSWALNGASILMVEWPTFEDIKTWIYEGRPLLAIPYGVRHFVVIDGYDGDYLHIICPTRGSEYKKTYEEFNPIRVFVPPANACLLYTSPSPRDGLLSRMPSSA